MLAYYLTWHLKHAWRHCSSKTSTHPSSTDPVAKATRSTTAKRKAQTKRTSTGEPAHSYKSLLAELATQTRNTIRLGHTTPPSRSSPNPPPSKPTRSTSPNTPPSPRRHDPTTHPAQKPTRRAKSPTPTTGNFGLS